MKRSQAILDTLKATPVYKNRIATDALFGMPEGSVTLNGNIDKAIRFIEDYQLLNAPLWAKFVHQFADTNPKADDSDYGWRGEYWGKMMRGACFTYSYTQNKILYDVLAETVRDMMNVQDSLGRISSYSVEKQYNGWDIWARKYVLLGMQYFAEICKDKKLIEDITVCMCKQVDYIIDTIGSEEGKIQITAASQNWNGLNSSSLLEPIVRLYNMTGCQKYLDFATYIISCGGTAGQNIFELAFEGKLYPYQYNVTKAYEMMSTFEGLLEYYRITGIKKWLTAVINFANLVTESDITVIGSAGCTHELFDHSRIRQLSTVYNGVMQETCVTVTWMKFCYQLLCMTGNSVFADEIERSVYNGMLGAINYDRHESNGRLPFDSYSPLLFNVRLTEIGGRMYMSDGTYYGCCACIGSAGTGIIPKYAFMLRPDGFAINLFCDGNFTAKTPEGNEIKISIKTKFPIEGSVSICIASNIKEIFTVAVRIPYWSEKTFAALNDEIVTVQSGEYACFAKEWTKGDEITLNLDMRCKVIYPDSDEYADENSKYHIALRRGPQMLARDARLPGDIESVVDLAPDEEGFVNCKISKTAVFDRFYEFSVTQADGSKMEFVDYPSAGRTWDKDSMTTVWLPTKNYWAVDLRKPLQLICPSFWSNNGEFYVIENSEGKVTVADKPCAGVQFEPSGHGKYKIRLASGRYLGFDLDKKIAVSNEDGCSWTLEHFVINKYKLVSETGLYLYGENEPGKALKLGLDTFKPPVIFRLRQECLTN